MQDSSRNPTRSKLCFRSHQSWHNATRYGISHCISNALCDPMFNGSTSDRVEGGTAALRSSQKLAALAPPIPPRVTKIRVKNVCKVKKWKCALLKLGWVTRDMWKFWQGLRRGIAAAPVILSVRIKRLSNKDPSPKISETKIELVWHRAGWPPPLHILFAIF